MNIIFLDVDGVLNLKKYKKEIGSKFDDPQYQIDPNAVAKLQQIVAMTNAKIVISSTWRLAFLHSANSVEKLQDCFALYGINDVVDFTPQIFGSDGTPLQSFRSDEINEWLVSRQNVNFVVLDDIDMTSQFGERMILTHEEEGLQDHDVETAIQILTKNP